MTRTRRRVQWSAALLSLALLATPPVVASGAEADPVLQEDAAFISAQTGAAPVTAKQLADQAIFSDYVTEIQSRYPQSYSRSGYDFGQAYLTFKGRWPSELEDEVAGMPISIELRGGGGSSEAEMLDKQWAAVQQLEAEGRVETSTVTFNAVESSMQVVYANGSGVESLPLEEAVEEAVEDAGPSSAETVDIDFQAVPELSAGVEVMGGGFITQCTAGFSVKTSTGVSRTGLLTAAHCPMPSKYEEGLNLNLSLHGNAYKKQGDLSFRSTSQSAGTPYFRWQDVGKPLRAVKSVGDATFNSDVCKYGRKTKRTCGKVWDVNVCANGYCGLIATTKYISGAGDSGGPWYIGERAVGIHQGYAYLQGNTRSLFSRVLPTDKIPGVPKVMTTK